jgi:hypothetical protein
MCDTAQIAAWAPFQIGGTGENREIDFPIG